MTGLLNADPDNLERSGEDERKVQKAGPAQYQAESSPIGAPGKHSNLRPPAQKTRRLRAGGWMRRVTVVIVGPAMSVNVSDKTSARALLVALHHVDFNGARHGLAEECR